MHPKKPTPPVSSGGISLPPPSTLTALSDSQLLLTEALRMLLPDDAALGRAIDRLRRLRYVHPLLDFDGREATFQSHAHGDEMQHVVGLDDDGEVPTIACSCPGGMHPWCVHRLRFRLELAEMALRDPVALLRLVMNQAAPHDGLPRVVGYVHDDPCG